MRELWIDGNAKEGIRSLGEVLVITLCCIRRGMECVSSLLRKLGIRLLNQGGRLTL